MLGGACHPPGKRDDQGRLARDGWAEPLHRDNNLGNSDADAEEHATTRSPGIDQILTAMRPTTTDHGEEGIIGTVPSASAGPQRAQQRRLRQLQATTIAVPSPVSRPLRRSWPASGAADQDPPLRHPHRGEARGIRSRPIGQQPRIQAALQTAAAPGCVLRGTLPAAQVQPSLPGSADEPVPVGRPTTARRRYSPDQRDEIRAAAHQAGQQEGGPGIGGAAGRRQTPGAAQACQNRLRLTVTPQPPVQRSPAADPQTGQQSGRGHGKRNGRPLSVPPCAPSPVRGSDPPIPPCPCRSSAVPPGSTG